MRTMGRRLHKLTLQGQGATDELAYVVEENVLAWRIVRLHGAGPAQAGRFADKARALRRLLLKSVVAGATITPSRRCWPPSRCRPSSRWRCGRPAAAARRWAASWPSSPRCCCWCTPIKHLSDVMAPITRGLAAVERSVDLIEQSPFEVGGTHARRAPAARSSCAT
jgi:subfamily B ATP-binding cassette protein MsbA